MSHYSFGDELWRVTITPVGTRPRLFRYKNRYASATFSFPPADGILNPEKLALGAGTIQLFALTHLALVRLRQLPREPLQMDSEQVSKLTGIPLPQEQRQELPGQTEVPL